MKTKQLDEDSTFVLNHKRQPVPSKKMMNTDPVDMMSFDCDYEIYAWDKRIREIDDWIVFLKKLKLAEEKNGKSWRRLMKILKDMKEVGEKRIREKQNMYRQKLYAKAQKSRNLNPENLIDGLQVDLSRRVQG